MGNSAILDSFTKKGSDIENIIGLPPSYIFEPNITGGDEHNLILGSMAVMALYPAYPTPPKELKGGLQLFSLDFDTGLEIYNNILDSAGVDIMDGNCLYVAFQNDASISESFSVEYGESKFEEIGNIAGSTITELRYLTGASGAGGAVQKIGEKMKGGGFLSGIAGKLAGVAGKGIEGVGNIFEGMTGNMGITKLATGSKIDFPQMWKGSGYSPSYSVTVRLYNPVPSDDAAHMKYIVEPLAKLLAFVIPISDSASTFTFPVLCSVTCPGLFKVKAGYISSIDVIKGGDANNISYVQRPGLVDIKLTINSLYNTMIAADPWGDAVKDKGRPLLGDYIEHLANSTAKIGKISTVDYPSFSSAPASTTGSTPESTDTAPARIPSATSSLANDLANWSEDSEP